jgi:subtilisin family serine protease
MHPMPAFRRRALPRCFVVLLALLFALAPTGAAGPRDFDQHKKHAPAASYVPDLRDAAHAWHDAGYAGQAVKVAILDSGFRGYQSQLGKALPAHVTVRSFRRDGNLEAKDSQHGILCAEVVHSLAPAAALLLANWDSDRPDQFLQAVRWARRQGAQIISCSLIMPAWGDGEGGGRTHEALALVLGSGVLKGDPLFFVSAGNVAQRNWSGIFRDGGHCFHEWRYGTVDNLLTPFGRERVCVELSWTGPETYAVSVFDRATGAEVARSHPATAGTSVARFEPDPGRAYLVRVKLVHGRPGRFHLVALGAGLEFAITRGSVPFPGDGAEVVAVGAVDAEGRRLSYSACGTDCKPVKPDFVAAVPVLSSFRTRPFAGTSATAPQAAAVAALIWSAHPDWTAAVIHQTLIAAARDLGPPGPDPQTGFGLIQLPPLPRQMAER